MFPENKMQESKDFDSISVTALRIISILNLLLNEPLNDTEINLKLQDIIKGFRPLSKDTICIYINTLRAIGCEISRPTKNNGYKYTLKSHPFHMNFSRDELNSVIEVRKYISTLGNWKLAVEIDELFEQIYEQMSNESKKFFMTYKKSELCREIDVKNISPDITLLEKYCSENKNITLVYESPSSGCREINMSAEKLTLENGSMYIWGFCKTHNETIYLRLDRIKSIKLSHCCENRIKCKILDVKYKISKTSAFLCIPYEGDKIIRETEKEFLIQAKIANKFKFIQEILSYGYSCTILSPQSLRFEVIAKLNKMSEVYKDVCIN